MLLNTLPLLLVSLVASVRAAPSPDPISALRVIGRTAKGNASEFDALYQGNQIFRASTADLNRELADKGQHPPFLFLGCSDSRVSEGTVFKAKPGTFFAERNVANLYEKEDANVNTILAYGVEHLHVKHIVVMGHYGCGGVQASIQWAPAQPWDEGNKAIQTWIKPIRHLYETSTRSEIVALRKQYEGKNPAPGPPNDDPGFRALVEENVKNTVKNIAHNAVVHEHLEDASAAELYIHGWVYDIATGEVRDLGISVGAHGKAIPPTPF